jgi:hypothetical protein
VPVQGRGRSLVICVKRRDDAGIRAAATNLLPVSDLRHPKSACSRGKLLASS